MVFDQSIAADHQDSARTNRSRRIFLKAGIAAGGGLMLGLVCPRSSGTPRRPGQAALRPTPSFESAPTGW